MATTTAFLAALLLVRGRDQAPSCESPTDTMFDATFVQLGPEQRRFDTARWTRELELLRGLGIALVIVQYTGDERGPYDRGTQRPVAELLAAAERTGVAVYLGLHHDPSWPTRHELGGLAPPLDAAPTAHALSALCTSSSACAGWYLSREIDDATWATPDRTAALRAHLARTVRALRELAPGKTISIAPFFTGALAPDAYARWWLDVLEPGTIDIVMLQDGVGTGRATPVLAGEYLAALGPALRTIDVELWSVAELFRQLHGAPVDDLPFEAVPIEPGVLSRSLAIERPLVARVVTFSVLDYMDPRRGGAALRLYDEYVGHCLRLL